MTVELQRQARQALERKRAAYQARRSAAVADIERTLPQAQAIAMEIRHILLGTLGKLFTPEGAQDVEKQAARSLQLQDKLGKLLEQHGFAADALQELPYCPLCKDAGHIHSRPCECLEVELREARKAQLGGLATVSFRQFNEQLFSTDTDSTWGLSQRENMYGNLMICKKWTEQFGKDVPNLFFNGGTGQGKTFLCACIADAVSAKQVHVCYTSAIALCTELERRHFERGETDVRPFYEAELLIIDDLGTEMTTAFVQSMMYDVINQRLLTTRKTIINANLTAQELRSRYMPQICSRLLGDFKQLHFFGPDLRLQKSKGGFTL